MAGAQPLRLLVAVDDSVNTSMRFLNAAPDATAVDVWVDGAKVDAMSGIAFGTASAYVRMPAGEHRIEVVDAGMTPSHTTPIVSVSETLGAARHHTFAISGLKAVAQPTLFRDESTGAAADKSHLRVVQLSSDTAAIDAGRKGDKAIVTDLAYGHDSTYATWTPARSTCPCAAPASRRTSSRSTRSSWPVTPATAPISSVRRPVLPAHSP